MSADNPIADRLHSIAIHLLRRVRRADQASGISPSELSALSVVVFAGPITLGELATAEQVRPPSMTRIVKILEGNGMIARERDETDRRVTRLRASASGEKLIKQGRSARVRLLADLLGDLEPSDLTSLDAAAKILERVLSVPRREPAERG
jgi:DNA-binding MarR family transcriptional regulator